MSIALDFCFENWMNDVNNERNKKKYNVNRKDMYNFTIVINKLNKTFTHTQKKCGTNQIPLWKAKKSMYKFISLQGGSTTVLKKQTISI